MTYKRTVPTVYVVSIPGNVIKAGMSTRQRWRNFVARGAEVVRLREFPDTLQGVLDAYEVESEIHAILRSALPVAYASAEEAKAALGNGGSGWKECYRVDSKNGLAISQPYGSAIEDLMARGLMARYGTVRNGTERHQDPGMNCPVSYAAGPVDKGSKR